MIAGTTEEAVEVYNRIGTSACSVIEEVLSQSNSSFAEVQSMLDYGSGYGRVLRAFVQKMPPSKISVFDIDPGAAAFCAQEFKVKPLKFKVQDEWDFSTVPFETYDVIWVGSVFTHLSLRYTIETMTLLASLLKPEGRLVFTTHGDETFPRMLDGFYGERIRDLGHQIMETYEKEGFSFTPLEKEDFAVLPFNFVRADDFGMTWIKPEFIDRLIQKIPDGCLVQRKYIPRGWDYHQDVYFYQRLS